MGAVAANYRAFAREDVGTTSDKSGSLGNTSKDMQETVSNLGAKFGTSANIDVSPASANAAPASDYANIASLLDTKAPPAPAARAALNNAGPSEQWQMAMNRNGPAGPG